MLDVASTDERVFLMVLKEISRFDIGTPGELVSVF
jgi:hypothetical protein